VSDGEVVLEFTPQQKSRIVALSAAIAGGVLFLFFVDCMVLHWFDPTFLFAWIFIMASDTATPVDKYAVPVLITLWCGSWMVTGLDSIRSPGSRRVAVTSLAVLAAGAVVLVLMFPLMDRIMVNG
jgi:hypothetical protein